MDQAQSENLLLNDILKYECEFELNESIDDSVVSSTAHKSVKEYLWI